MDYSLDYVSMLPIYIIIVKKWLEMQGRATVTIGLLVFQSYGT